MIQTARQPAGRIDRARHELLDLAAGVRSFLPPRHHGLRAIVTGSPRSGSSFLTGMIHRLGLDPGPQRWLKRGDEHNPLGYYECVPIKSIEINAFDQLATSFHDPTGFDDGWDSRLPSVQQQIKRIVRLGRLELYKGNRLMVLADLFDACFPEARWVYIHREIEANYNSQFGEPMSFEQWRDLTDRRYAIWQASRPAAKALHIDYEDFRSHLDETIERVISHLKLSPTREQVQAARAFYRPRDRRAAA